MDWTVDYKEGHWELATPDHLNIMPTTTNIGAAHRAAVDANQQGLTLSHWTRVAELVRKWNARYKKAKPRKSVGRRGRT
jgi:hypothetical protein